MLRKLSESVVDIIKLNIATSVLVNLSTLGYLVWKYVFAFHNLPMGFVMQAIWLVYALSNPLVYALTMTELKKQYKKIWMRMRRR